MYSSKVLEHLENPRNVGVLEDADATGVASNPVCGDQLHLYLKIESGSIIAARFQVEGCPPSISAGSILTEILSGMPVDQARELSARDITQALETLPRNKEHCSILAIDALRSALAQLQRDVL